MAEKRRASKDAALEYHASGRPGKIQVVTTKSVATQRDLSLAYSPGVAYPCLEIAKNPDDAYLYTGKGNLVGVISNGSAVLGLGNIGAQAGKPVMEGKGVLFKKFADIDVFDLEINAATTEEMVQVIKALEPTFGGINLEDIKAPECFEVERQLQELMDIPVFHDDQHGTAIIASAAFLNALIVAKKKIDKVKVVFSGAGAASIACARLFLKLGVKKENLLMVDSQGVIYLGRTTGMNAYKETFAIETPHRTMSDALKNADAFIGCSAKGLLTSEMVATMAKTPIIFAMANPDPEITPEEVHAVRDDAIMATGRSDYPNQVNNVLGFPFIFRGALDVRARKINEEMKLAAVHALADLAREHVPDEVRKAYGNEQFKFGKDYLIPKPFDKRVLTRLCPAIAKAAQDSGVARKPLPDLKAYAEDLEKRLGSSVSFVKSLRDRLNPQTPVKIIFPEATNVRILQAISILREERRVAPILIGDPVKIHQKMNELQLDSLCDLPIISPTQHPSFNEFVLAFHHGRARKGISFNYAKELMERPNYFAAMMVKKKLADGLITGATQNYPECVRPIMQIIGADEHRKSAGVIILVFENRILFLADCTMQVSPTAEDLAVTAESVTKLYRNIMLQEPKIAFLSFSNFGSNDTGSPKTVAKAVTLAKKLLPGIELEGEMQADVAVNEDIRKNLFMFNELHGNPDILIFPDLNSANISYKLLAQLGGATAIGPILIPLQGAANVVQRTSSVTEIVHMSTITALLSTLTK